MILFDSKYPCTKFQVAVVVTGSSQILIAGLVVPQHSKRTHRCVSHIAEMLDLQDDGGPAGLVAGKNDEFGPRERP